MTQILTDFINKQKFNENLHQYGIFTAVKLKNGNIKKFQPPKNKRTIIVEKTRMLQYSPKKKRAKPVDEYSV